jgi:hypothetical protein
MSQEDHNQGQTDAAQDNANNEQHFNEMGIVGGTLSAFCGGSPASTYNGGNAASKSDYDAGWSNVKGK